MLRSVINRFGSKRPFRRMNYLFHKQAYFALRSCKTFYLFVQT
jgi:hypothetical protein